ncbi:hypothetical protein LSH36_1780g00002 [Paralvinella palmiformis]|uniref:Caspase family p10 domain-containing protein n=1 Tax=Paralvinella palmiformis TaxID=53620 RepID=A0AAD9MMY5_9ANNE|nr:hypothetical protein LSH36_1780g00002 [Paralvinella palmiformis]
MKRTDFVYAYSTVLGHESYRHCSKGSWFIQALCETLRGNADNKDFISLLTRVNNKVNNNEDGIKKQVSCFTSTLTKFLYFPKINTE